MPDFVQADDFDALAVADILEVDEDGFEWDGDDGGDDEEVVEWTSVYDDRYDDFGYR